MRLVTELPPETSFLKHSVAARIHGVHTRTLSRWVEAGIIPPPDRRSDRRKGDQRRRSAPVGDTAPVSGQNSSRGRTAWSPQ
jgi:hypothetical protein